MAVGLDDEEGTSRRTTGLGTVSGPVNVREPLVEFPVGKGGIFAAMQASSAAALTPTNVSPERDRRF